MPGGDEVDHVPGRQRRELVAGVGDAQPLLELVPVPGGEQARAAGSPRDAPE
ncbi:MAG TPA: hypothetical protein VGH27_30040 [Streptosporangiaceae bacterium]|jgi:hypothetical protein